MPLVQEPLLDLGWLADVHKAKRLRLATGAGMSGLVHLNGSPEALVTELIRLAGIGQYCERAALDDPDRCVGAVVLEVRP